ncbi:hypothetical protein KAS42_02430 [bacterium]|nr:hypothetical protein [bacterium]
MDTQVVTNVCYLVIACAAVFVAVWQVITTREHNRCSVKPHLSFERCTSNQSKIVLSNEGTGPAFIKDVRIYLDSKLIENFDYTSWRKIVAQLKLNAPDVMGLGFDPDGVIGQDRSRTVLSIRTINNTTDEIMQQFHRINIEIDYTSVYGDRFQVTLNSDLKKNSPKS